MNNFFAVPEAANATNPEFLETVLRGSGALRIERILSHGHTTPKDSWYDQEEDEWVLVMEGKALLLFPDGKEVSLEKGEHYLLPKHTRHRVIYTSTPCLWLAVFGEILTVPGNVTDCAESR